MSETDYNTLLHEKMKQEYNEFIEELKQMSTEQIIEHAYEKVFKEEFLNECEATVLEQQEAKALYLQKHPLDRIYRDWLDNDFSYMDIIRDTLCDSAKDAVKEHRAKQRESR